MSSNVRTVPGGRYRFPWMLLALLATLMVALHLSRTRADPTTDTAGPRARGLSYEAHVLAPERLPAEIAGQGGHLRLHPTIWPPVSAVDAHYYATSEGFRGGAQPDPSPHATAPTHWPSVGRGGYRIPDALAVWPDGREILFELKCPSPWLTFAGGLPWAAKMQAAFGSQALAFLSWASEAPTTRGVVYGFCGEAPPWAAAILRDPAHRRRFAQAVACALAHQPSYDLEAWPADQLSPVLERRALQADWPMIANADTVVLLRPAPLPETPDALIAEATATLPEPTRTAMTATLHTLWQGGWPTPDLVAATGEAVGEAIRRAARAGNEAAEAALQLADARALGA